MTSDRGSIGYNNRESLSPEAAAIALGRSASQQSAARKSANASTTALPTPPPSIPLPALPGSERATSPIQGSASPPASRHTSKDGAGASAGMTQMIEDQEARIRTIEKHLEHVYRKIGVHDRLNAVRTAQELGLLSRGRLPR